MLSQSVYYDLHDFHPYIGCCFSIQYLRPNGANLSNANQSFESVAPILLHNFVAFEDKNQNQRVSYFLVQGGGKWLSLSLSLSLRSKLNTSYPHTYVYPYTHTTQRESKHRYTRERYLRQVFVAKIKLFFSVQFKLPLCTLVHLSLHLSLPFHSICCSNK